MRETKANQICVRSDTGSTQTSGLLTLRISRPTNKERVGMKKCNSKDCDRMVKEGISHCCIYCATKDLNISSGPLKHDASCNWRHAEYVEKQPTEEG